MTRMSILKIAYLLDLVCSSFFFFPFPKKMSNAGKIINDHPLVWWINLNAPCRDQNGHVLPPEYMGTFFAWLATTHGFEADPQSQRPNLISELDFLLYKAIVLNQKTKYRPGWPDNIATLFPLAPPFRSEDPSIVDNVYSNEYVRPNSVEPAWAHIVREIWRKAPPWSKPEDQPIVHRYDLWLRAQWKEVLSRLNFDYTDDTSSHAIKAGAHVVWNNSFPTAFMGNWPFTRDHLYKKADDPSRIFHSRSKLPPLPIIHFDTLTSALEAINHLDVENVASADQFMVITTPYHHHAFDNRELTGEDLLKDGLQDSSIQAANNSLRAYNVKYVIVRKNDPRILMPITFWQQTRLATDTDIVKWNSHPALKRPGTTKTAELARFKLHRDIESYESLHATPANYAPFIPEKEVGLPELAKVPPHWLARASSIWEVPYTCGRTHPFIFLNIKPVHGSRIRRVQKAPTKEELVSMKRDIVPYIGNVIKNTWSTKRVIAMAIISKSTSFHVPERPGDHPDNIEENDALLINVRAIEISDASTVNNVDDFLTYFDIDPTNRGNELLVDIDADNKLVDPTRTWSHFCQTCKSPTFTVEHPNNADSKHTKRVRLAWSSVPVGNKLVKTLVPEWIALYLTQPNRDTQIRWSKLHWRPIYSLANGAARDTYNCDMVPVPLPLTCGINQMQPGQHTTMASSYCPSYWDNEKESYSMATPTNINVDFLRVWHSYTVPPTFQPQPSVADKRRREEVGSAYPGSAWEQLTFESKCRQFFEESLKEEISLYADGLRTLNEANSELTAEELTEVNQVVDIVRNFNVNTTETSDTDLESPTAKCVISFSGDQAPCPWAMLCVLYQRYSTQSGQNNYREYSVFQSETYQSFNLPEARVAFHGREDVVHAILTRTGIEWTCTSAACREAQVALKSTPNMICPWPYLHKIPTLRRTNLFPTIRKNGPIVAVHIMYEEKPPKRRIRRFMAKTVAEAGIAAAVEYDRDELGIPYE